MELSYDPGLDGVRFPAAVESTAYFVVSEAVTNALKYAGPGPINVKVERTDDRLVVAVADHGPGERRIVPGGGLAGLLDRVRALGGALEVASPDGDGSGSRRDCRSPSRPNGGPNGRASTLAGVVVHSGGDPSADPAGSDSRMVVRCYPDGRGCFDDSEVRRTVPLTR